MEIRHESLWRATHQLPRFPPLRQPLQTDVVIVGGGVSGLTAAVILARAGRRVAVIERDGVAAGETGNTTAHLTEALDARYGTITRDFGAEGARLAARSSRDAIEWIEQLAGTGGADVGFTRLAGYLYTEHRADLEALRAELESARLAGCAVTWTDAVPLPFITSGGIQWERQAQLHATAYVDALVHEALAHGVRIFDHTRAVAVTDGEPCRVETDHGELRAADVFVAANVPVNNRVLLQTKIAAYRSYAIGVDVTGGLTPGLFWDTATPYHYTRLQAAEGRTWLIAGGEDHRTGTEGDTESHYLRLREFVQQRFGGGVEGFRWSGQVIEPVDGLPYIGLNAGSHHVYVATGYSGNGMTFGTLSGMLIGDLVLGRPNPYAELYAATRITPMASAVNYVTENLAFPAHLIADRLTNLDVERRPVDALNPGEGGIFSSDEGKVAVSRGSDGTLRAVSAVCTHLGCDVAWNGAEKTWDCPCHGSRFSPEGQVINGPAVTDLPARPVPTLLTRM